MLKYVVVPLENELTKEDMLDDEAKALLKTYPNLIIKKKYLNFSSFLLTVTRL